MMKEPAPIIVLSGAGGGTPNLEPFRETSTRPTKFLVIDYPGWRQYASSGCSIQSIVEYLAREIGAHIPNGPIRIMGISIGGHFGYAAAVQLQASGRDISGFCAIDSFTVSSGAPSSGWLRRAVLRGSQLIREFRIVDLAKFIRSRLWRAMLRLPQDYLLGLFSKAERYGLLRRILTIDPILETELSMRLLIRSVAPGLAALDHNPVALRAPAILLRSGLTGASDACWRRRCPELTIVEVPGNHETMFELPNVAVLSREFTEATKHWRSQ